MIKQLRNNPDIPDLVKAELHLASYHLNEALELWPDHIKED